MSTESEIIDISSESDAVLVHGDLTDETLTKRDDAGGDRVGVDNELNESGVDVNSNFDVFEEFEAFNGGSSMDGDKEEDVTMVVEGENQAMDIDPRGEMNENQVEVEVAVGDDSDNENNSMDSDDKRTALKPEFGVNDIVWGKVRSHPWWPGQILDPSAASKKTKKYFKKDSHLIGYFGDKTFAWNTVSQIKAFQPNFEQLEKQSDSEDFQDAIDCALKEVSRRVEYSLACRCTPEDVYAEVKTQVIDNTGIKEEASRRDGGDSFSSADSFELTRPVRFIKELAQQPLGGGVKRLDFTIAQAQLLAFYRWKGYSQLPELKMLGGLLESDGDIPKLFEEANQCNQTAENAAPAFKNVEQVANQEGKSKSQHVSSQKRKQISDNINRDSSDEQTDNPIAKYVKTQLLPEAAVKYSQKRKQISDGSYHDGKEESLSKLIAKKQLSAQISKEGLNIKAGDKLVSSSSGKKRKMVINSSDEQTDNPIANVKTQLSSEADKSVSSSSGKKRKKVKYIIDSSIEQTDNPIAKYVKTQFLPEAAVKYSRPKKTFGVGSSILKVASQLSKSSPILKSSLKTAGESASKGKPVYGKSESKKNSPLAGGMLSQLCLSAQDPMKRIKLIISMVNFFSEFRDSVCFDLLNTRDAEIKVDQISMENAEEKLILEKSEASYIDPQKDSDCTDKIIEGESGEQPLSNNDDEGKQFLPETPSVKAIPTDELDLSTNMDSGRLTVIEEEKVAIQLDENDNEKAAAEEQPAVLNPVTDSGRNNVSEDIGLEADKIISPVNEDSTKTSFSTALMLNFSDLNCIPSETDLNSIFSRYGPIFESKTQVLKKSNRVRVVFKRRADAETAFSSAGKYSIFGPALVSYRLKHVPITPVKASPGLKGGRKKATPTPVVEEKQLDM